MTSLVDRHLPEDLVFAPAPARRAAMSWQARAGLLGALLLGVLLLLLATPRLIGAIIDLPGDRVIGALKQDQTVTDQALEGLVVARRAALPWHGRAEAHRDIGAALLALAYRHGDEDLDQAMLDSAEEAIRRALVRAPVDPYSWARLATLAWVGERDPAKAREALRASVRVGAYDPHLAAWRSRLVLTLWPHLPLDERLLYLDQLRQLWSYDPDELARLTADERALQIALAALIDPTATADLRARREALRVVPSAAGADHPGSLEPSGCCE